MPQYAVQVIASTGALSSFDVIAPGDPGASALALARHSPPDEGADYTLVVLSLVDGRVVSTRTMVHAPTAVGLAKAAAIAARLAVSAGSNAVAKAAQIARAQANYAARSGQAQAIKGG